MLVANGITGDRCGPVATDVLCLTAQELTTQKCAPQCRPPPDARREEVAVKEEAGFDGRPKGNGRSQY